MDEDDDNKEENSSTVKRRGQYTQPDANSSASNVQNFDKNKLKKKESLGALSSKNGRRNSDVKTTESNSRQEGILDVFGASNGSGTLGRSRKKKAAPQPPATQQSDCSSKNNDCSSSSSISKSSGKKTSRKEKKHSSSSFAVSSSNYEECPFLAFKVKVRTEL